MAQRVREDTYLNRDESDALQEVSDQLDVSKSQFIRDAINEKIARVRGEVEA